MNPSPIENQKSVIGNRQSTIGSPEPIAALNRVRITEYRRAWEEREPLVDIRAVCPDVVCNEGICPYLRQSVADKLNHAQNSLPAGYRLKVGTALRTLSMQQRGWDGYFKKMQEAHPTWPLASLRRATNKYHAPYDQKAPPGHCTGGAVDVGLLDLEGNALDMIAPTQGWDAVDTFSDKISPEARANRMQMVEAMLGAGFSNCRDEYWHYSWGDSAWAVRVGESECPFGWTYAPPQLEITDLSGAVREQALDVKRDFHGRPQEAWGACDWHREADEFRVGLLWVKGTPVTLRILYYKGRSQLAPPQTFFIGDGKETWEPITGDRHGDETYALRVTPTFDRAVIANRVPEAKDSRE